MSLRKPLACCLFAALSLAIPAISQQTPPSGAGLTINDADRITLTGNLPGQLRQATDEGLAAADLPMDRMIMVLAPRANKRAEREQLIRDLHDPGSPLFHQWLTPEQYAQRFGVSDAELNSVIAWLQSYGFTVDEVARGRGWINFTGTATQVETAFRTQIRRYRLNGALHHANASPISIPRGLSSIVVGLVSLDDFQKKPMHVVPQAVDPNFNYGSSHYLAPADFATIYNVSPLYAAGTDGTGQKIAIVGRTDIKLSDVQTFRSYFGLPAKDPVFIHNGPDPGNLGGGEETEADLDVEWSGAVGRNATVNFVISKSTSTTDGVDLSAQYIVDNNVAPVMSTSFGECESQLGSAENAFYNNLWAQAATQGITSFVSTGDSGASGCDAGDASFGTGRAVSGLSTTPYNVAVGGTEFMDAANPAQYWASSNDSVTKGSVLSFIPEMAWNESGAVSGGSDLWSAGGGVSTIYAKPSWQVAPGVPADGKRDVPDVSLNAATHDGYLIFQGGSLGAVGGTSASSPSFAGLLSLVNQATGTSQGNANTVFYALGNNQYNGCAPTIFNDTTVGNNSVPRVTGFSATTAYDLATGLGSVNATALVQNWSANATFLVCASPASVSALQGGMATTTIDTSASGSFNSSISLSATGLPTGVTAAFSPVSIAAPGTGSSTLTLAVGPNVTPGTYPITVSGTGVSMTHSTTVTLLVAAAPDFTIAASPGAITVPQAQSGTSGISTTAIAGFNSAVTLSSSGAPAGVTVGFIPGSITGSGSSTATFTVASSAPTGTYPITITGTSGALTHSTTVNLTVAPAFDFAISANPAGPSASAGGTGSSTISTTALNGFNSAITLSASGMPTGVTVAFGANPIPAPGNGSSTATFTVASTVAAGTYPITITGSGGGLMRNASVNLTVTPVVTSGWQAGFDFRATSTYVTDPANSVYVTGDSYPTARGGFTFGWTSASGLLARDRSKSVDPRLAGIQAVSNNGAPLTFEIDVPAPGTYAIALAMGDAGSPQSDASIGFLDGSTPLFTVSAAQIAANNFVDATGVARTGAQWPSANVVKQVTLTGTRLMVTVGSNIGKAEYTPVAFIGLAQVGGGSPTPDFTISAAPTAVSAAQGGLSSSSITTTAVNGFNSDVTLSATGAPAGVTVGFDTNPIATGNGSSNATFTVASSTPTGVYPITITGSGGGLMHSATVNLTVTAAPDFTITAAPLAISVAPGSSGPSTVTTAALNGFNSTLTLSASGMPTGVTVGFGTNPIAAPGNGTSTATFTVDSSVASGTYPISITGNGGGLIHSTTVNLTVTTVVTSGWQAGFDFRATPGYAIDPANSVYVTGDHYPTTRGGFTFGWTSTSGLLARDRSKSVDPRLAGIQAVSNNGAPLTFEIDVPAPGTYTVALAMGDAGSPQSDASIAFLDGSTPLFTVSAAQIAANNFADATGVARTAAQWPSANVVRQVTLTGAKLMVTVGSNIGKSEYTPVAFIGVAQVGGGSPTPDFTISAAPTAVSAAQGGANSSTVTTTAVNGFNSDVTLSAAGAPAGVTVGFDTNPITTGNGSSNVTFTVSSGAATGTYPIMITGSGGGAMHSTSVNLTVTGAPDFTITAAPLSVSVAAGSSGPSTVTTTALNGFNSAISLSASGMPTGVTVGFGANPIAAPGNGSSVATFTVDSSAATGTYPITITGNGNGLMHSTTVNLTVTPAQQQAFNVGFDFRGSQAYVTDPASDNYVLGGSTRYPTTRNGVTFGWTGTIPSTRDRSKTVDPRLAGINFVAGNVAPGVFQIDLPGPGTYTITLAMGDATSQQVNCKVEFKDGSTSLFAVSANSLSAGAFADANGAIWTSSQWPSSNTTRQVTVTGSTLTMYVGANNGNSSATTVAFVGVSQ